MRSWVVGGSSGIGAAVAGLLDRAGHLVFATGSEVDVRDDRLLSAYVEENGPFDNIVYSAGVNHLQWVEKLIPSAMEDLLNVNVIGLVRVLQASPDVQRVAVIGSDAAWRPMRTSAVYNASKAALHALVQCIARERASEHFSINVVAPGLVEDTAMTEYVRERTTEVRGWDSEATDDYMIQQIPLGRPAEPDEVAEVVYAVLCLNPSLNGAIIPVNGAR